jgi:ABC-type sugar transport system ATPase subunit
MEPALLEFKNVSITLGRGPDSYEVLNNFSFAMKRGELVVVIGDSGSGKSTLLHHIAGLLKPYARGLFSQSVRPGFIPCARIEGDVCLNGERITTLEPQFRQVGLVLQQHGIYEHMSVWDNLAFPLRLRGASFDQIVAEINKVAADLDITDFLTSWPATLSGGQLQRVALGKLLLKRPQIALLDEAFAHIDPLVEQRMTAKLMDAIQLEHQSLEGAVMVTHDITQTENADRILLFCKSLSRREKRYSKVIEFSRDPSQSALDKMKKCDETFGRTKDWCELVSRLDRKP